MSHLPVRVGSGNSARPGGGGEITAMSTAMVPATGAEALGMLEAALEFLAAEDPAGMPTEAAAGRLRALERADAVEAAVRGRLLVVFDAQDAHLADGQRSTRAWLVHVTGVTKGQAGEYLAIEALARWTR